MTLENCRLYDLPKFLDPRGNLSFLEEFKHVPFEIKRAYWVYDVPGGERRGGHSFKKSQEVIIALSGSFDIVLDDGRTKKLISINRSYHALYIPNLIWRHLENFSTNSLALVVSSTSFDEADYERDYENFVKDKLHAIE